MIGQRLLKLHFLLEVLTNMLRGSLDTSGDCINIVLAWCGRVIQSRLLLCWGFAGVIVYGKLSLLLGVQVLLRLA